MLIDTQTKSSCAVCQLQEEFQTKTLKTRLVLSNYFIASTGLVYTLILSHIHEKIWVRLNIPTLAPFSRSRSQNLAQPSSTKHQIPFLRCRKLPMNSMIEVEAYQGSAWTVIRFLYKKSLQTPRLKSGGIHHSTDVENAEIFADSLKDQWSYNQSPPDFTDFHHHISKNNASFAFPQDNDFSLATMIIGSLKNRKSSGLDNMINKTFKLLSKNFILYFYILLTPWWDRTIFPPRRNMPR